MKILHHHYYMVLQFYSAKKIEHSRLKHPVAPVDFVNLADLTRREFICGARAEKI